MDLDALEPHLEMLMKCYRDALRFVEGLPRLGRVQVEYVYEKGDAVPKKSKWIARAIYRVTNPSHRWVARALVRLFLEAHIRTKLELIIRFLRIEASVAIKEQESNARAKTLKSLVTPLDDLQKAMFGWRQRGAVFAKMPFLPVLIALATPFLARLTGIDFSGAKGIAESTLERAQTGGLARSLGLAALILGQLYTILAPALTILGFRIKRAILVGGITEWRLYEDEPVHLRWLGFPATKTYHAENQAFAVIGIQKPKEFPLDFVMAFRPFYLFVFVVLFSSGAVKQLFAGGSLTLWNCVGLAALWVVLISITVYGWKNYRRRRDQLNM